MSNLRLSAISITVDKIWSNADQDSDFEQQYLELNTKYKLYIITFSLASGRGINVSHILPAGIQRAFSITDRDSLVYFRDVLVEENLNRILIGDCKDITTWEVNNSIMIPIDIYGIN